MSDKWSATSNFVICDGLRTSMLAPTKKQTFSFGFAFVKCTKKVSSHGPNRVEYQLYTWKRLWSSWDLFTPSLSGHYARLLRSNGRLVSPQLRGGESSSRRCVKFWHYLSGGETETLNVSRVTNFRNEETVWSVRATQVRARRWLPGSAELLGYEGPLMVRRELHSHSIRKPQKKKCWVPPSFSRNFLPWIMTWIHAP